MSIQTRKLSSSGTDAVRSTTPRCNAIAHSTTSTALANSASSPSPMSELEYSPRMPLNLRFKQVLAPRLQPRKRPRLIALHERGVTCDNGRENGSEVTFHGRWPCQLQRCDRQILGSKRCIGESGLGHTQRPEAGLDGSGLPPKAHLSLWHALVCKVPKAAYRIPL